MSEQDKKARLFRILKVVFYCLGTPLFLFAVILLSSQLYGHYPFAGDPGTGFFDAIKVFFTSPALYSVWIAIMLLVVIGAIEIICTIYIKNRHHRLIVVAAILLIIVIVPVVVIDAVYTAKIEDITASASENVTVKDYKYQLSYYHTHSSGGEENGKRTSLVDTLIDRTTSFCTYYNILYYGNRDAFISKTNNSQSQALYYDDYNFDYDEDGWVTWYDEVIVGSEYEYIAYSVKAGADGFASKPLQYLTDEYGNKIAGGDVQDHIRIQNTFDLTKNKSRLTNGRYWFDSITLTSKNGKYNSNLNGNFFCITYENPYPTAMNSSDTRILTHFVWYDGDKASVEITEGHYGNAYYNKNGLFSEAYVYDIDVALNVLEAYYQAQEDMTSAYRAYKKAAGSSALSEGDLQALIIKNANAKLQERYTGANATDEDKELWARENAYASKYSLTSSELTSVLGVLGANVGSAKTITSLLSLINTAIGLSFDINTILTDIVGLSDGLATWATDLLGLTGTTISISSTTGLTLTFSGGVFSTPVDVVLDSTFSAESLGGVLTALGIDNNMLVEVISLLGLTAKADGDLNDLVASIISSLYWYQSPVIDCVYDYYADANDNTESATALQKATYAYASAYSEYMRASYEGGAHGLLCGSRLIGSTIGLGTYSSDMGLTTLAEVQQLKLDLSYQPEMYSILIVRDMLMTFGAFIIFFTILSYVAAEREYLYASGQLVASTKKFGCLKKEDINREFKLENTTCEDTTSNVEENNVKEDENND